jgi:Flp pilus assembly protein TadD
MGQYDLAIADFTIVIKMDSENADAYKNRGMSYQLLGKTAEAEADFAKYKELTGEDAP